MEELVEELAGKQGDNSMAVESLTVQTIIASSGSGQLEFFFDFPIINDADIVVTKNSVIESTALYTVTFDEGDQGGSIVYSIAPDEFSEIIISRHTSLTQDLTFPTGGPFPSKSHENALDKLTMLIQEMFSRGVMDRSKSITIELPVDGENLTLFYTTSIITVSELASVVSGVSPSQDWTMRFGPNRDDIGTEIINGGSTTADQDVGLVETTLDNDVIPANSWVWLTTATQSGTVERFHVTMTYTQN